MQRHELPDGWDQAIPTFPADAKGIASRDSSAKVQNAIAPHLPWLIGGSADLAPSTKTLITARRRRRPRGREPRRPQPAFRHSRACHGGRLQRPGA